MNSKNVVSFVLVKKNQIENFTRKNFCFWNFCKKFSKLRPHTIKQHANMIFWRLKKDNFHCWSTNSKLFFYLTFQKLDFVYYACHKGQKKILTSCFIYQTTINTTFTIWAHIEKRSVERKTWLCNSYILSQKSVENRT